MTSIITTWRNYFENRDEGLGTTYERFILHSFFEELKNFYSIKSVIEIPSFGMTGISGINSIWWALNDSIITIVDHDKERIDLIKNLWQELSLEANFIYDSNDYRSLPFNNSSFDLGWNFASLWFIPDLELFIKELTRISKKVIFICLPNTQNLFFTLRMKLQQNHNRLYLENINIKRIKELMLKFNWQIVRRGYLDIPPWPDIAMKKEDLFKLIGLKCLLRKFKNNNYNQICIVNFYTGRDKEMENTILKFSFLENSPLSFKKIWAHHQYLICTPISSDY